MMRWIALLSILLLPPLLHADAARNPLDIRLISETRSIRAGGGFFLGLHLRHPEGAHSYWKHPGIVGLATQIEWDLPKGFVAGPIQWPAPEIVKMAVYQAQGYHGETLLLIPVKAPDILTTSSITLSAKVSWMCCAETCHPAAKVPFSITLPVTAAVEKDPVNGPLFATFRARIPTRDPNWKTTVTRTKNQMVLNLQAPPASQPLPTATGIRFFTADGQVDSNQPQQVEILPDRSIRMTLARSEAAPLTAASLPGVVVFPNGHPSGGSPISLEIDPRY